MKIKETYPLLFSSRTSFSVPPPEFNSQRTSTKTASDENDFQDAIPKNKLTILVLRQVVSNQNCALNFCG